MKHNQRVGNIHRYTSCAKMLCPHCICIPVVLSKQKLWDSGVDIKEEDPRPYMQMSTASNTGLRIPWDGPGNMVFNLLGIIPGMNHSRETSLDLHEPQLGFVFRQPARHVLLLRHAGPLRERRRWRVRHIRQFRGCVVQMAAYSTRLKTGALGNITPVSTMRPI